VNEFDTILLERTGRVGTVTLNRTKALNALNTAMLAAGADIKEMRPRTYIDMFASDFLAGWERLAAVRKPTIAAVAGMRSAAPARWR